MVKIKDMKERERYDIPLLVKECRNGTTSKGAPYLNLVLQDSAGTIDAKYWDVKPADLEVVKTGRIVQFAFDVLLYNGSLQLRVARASAIDENQVKLEEYLISAAQPEEARRRSLDEYLGSIRNENYRKLVTGLLELIGDRYFSYPAASRIHHSYLGGLSEHSLSMASMAEDICRHYPQLNHDLLISGALIHDIGKTAEMSGAVSTEYTLEGKLEGHISLANGWLTEVAARLDLDDTEECILLHHMILSHHGHYEFGSPVLPMVMEAEVLSLIDNLDARMNTITHALESTPAGGWTSKLFALENRQFYKPKKAQ